MKILKLITYFSNLLLWILISILFIYSDGLYGLYFLSCPILFLIGFKFAKDFELSMLKILESAKWDIFLIKLKFANKLSIGILLLLVLIIGYYKN